jgi:hypothetical protein
MPLSFAQTVARRECDDVSLIDKILDSDPLGVFGKIQARSKRAVLLGLAEADIEMAERQQREELALVARVQALQRLPAPAEAEPADEEEDEPTPRITVKPVKDDDEKPPIRTEQKTKRPRVNKLRKDPPPPAIEDQTQGERPRLADNTQPKKGEDFE